MILFLEFKVEGRRGGESYHGHLHTFLLSHFGSVLPESYSNLPAQYSSRRQQISFCSRLVKEHRPKLVVSDISSATRNFDAIRCAKRSGASVLLVVQGVRQIASKRSWLTRLLAKRCEEYLYNSADILLANSRFTANAVKQKLSRDIPTVIGSPGLELAYDKCAGPNEVSVAGPLRLLYVGECSRVKGLRYLVEAMTLLSDLDVTLDVVGGHSQEPEYYQSIREFVRSHDLSERVLFHGFVNRIGLKQFYSSCSVALVPSLSEGYGLVLAEALAHGLPIIATDAGAIPEMVSDRVNALLVKSADHTALVAAIRNLANNQTLRKQMSETNFLRAESLPTWDDFNATLRAQLAPLIETSVSDETT